MHTAVSSTHPAGHCISVVVAVVYVGGVAADDHWLRPFHLRMSVSVAENVACTAEVVVDGLAVVVLFVAVLVVDGLFFAAFVVVYSAIVVLSSVYLFVLYIAAAVVVVCVAEEVCLPAASSSV